MNKKNQKIMDYTSAFLDVILIYLSMILAFYIRFLRFGGVMTVTVKWYLLLATIDLPVHLLTFSVLKLNSDRIADSAYKGFLRTFICTVICFAIFVSILYFIKEIDFSRLVLFIFLIIENILFAFKRLIQIRIFRRRGLLGISLKRTVLIGSGEMARRYYREICRCPELGYSILGYVAEQNDWENMRYLGNIAGLLNVLDMEKPDDVVAALDIAEYTHITEIIRLCEQDGVRFSLIPVYSQYVETEMQSDSINGIPMLNLRKIPLDNMANAAIKRVVDIIGSSLLIILTSPLMLATAIGVKISSPGPIIFKQERIGYGKKSFYMYKFRSMRVNNEQNTAWSTDSDSRRTPFGEFIRKYSIDELPQFFNVLKGDMSLVGPRPEIPYYVSQFRDSIPRYLVRQQVRPGITGWAQVNGLRGNTSIEERARYDRWYIEHWTFWLDIMILLRTVFGGFINSETITTRKTPPSPDTSAVSTQNTNETVPEIKMLVATHKEYSISEDDLYLPIHVGAALHDYSLPFITDSTGENISEKNQNYCELTAVYWAWKNLKSDYIGLCHYRRYFCGSGRKILTLSEVEKLLQETPVLLPKKRNYFIETNYSQYAHAHHEEDLVLLRNLLLEKEPDYIPAFDATMKRTSGHRFNMFLMRWDIFDAYCTWLFPVLEEVENRVDISNYDAYNARVFGFLGERLLDVWLETNNIETSDIPYVFTEKQNWLKKGFAFLSRKFFGKMLRKNNGAGRTE